MAPICVKVAPCAAVPKPLKIDVTLVDPIGVEVADDGTGDAASEETECVECRAASHT